LKTQKILFVSLAYLLLVVYLDLFKNQKEQKYFHFLGYNTKMELQEFNENCLLFFYFFSVTPNELKKLLVLQLFMLYTLVIFEIFLRCLSWAKAVLSCSDIF
jgi:hypothetical protein